MPSPLFTSETSPRRKFDFFILIPPVIILGFLLAMTLAVYYALRLDEQHHITAINVDTGQQTSVTILWDN